jgi:hypothetical protein
MTGYKIDNGNTIADKAVTLKFISPKYHFSV